MPAKVDEDNCTGCGDCVEVCPVGTAIAMEHEKAKVAPDDCIECNACVDACTHDAMGMSG